MPTIINSTNNNNNTILNKTCSGKRRYNIKLWKTFTDCFNCLPVAAVVDEKIFCMHGGLSPDLQNMEQIKRIMRPTGTYLLTYLPIYTDLFTNYICMSMNDRYS